ncbi:Hypothetical predicted protein [Mytilus galloprovincialis]|uniref:J domain-containing protein n=1 Tax=Mytilus galloprovincialis TaxID=29158 RepID=A0A8B6BSJ7_MYTGA|nr:Hypothetical predicted protein [Mytilus galloprovincialis]
MGNETSKDSTREFESIPDLYKFLLKDTFNINCQLNEEFLRRYNGDVFMSIHSLATSLYERNFSGSEIQQMNTSFEKIVILHRRRVFQFTHAKCKGRYQKFPEDKIKKAEIKHHKMHKIPADISAFASDFGTEERKFNFSLYGKMEHIENEIKTQIENALTNLLPEVIYKRKVCSETFCIDGGKGKIMRYKVCPVEADFYPGNPYTVKPIKQDSLQIIESRYYVWIENGKINLSKTDLKEMKKGHIFVVPTLELNGSVLVELEGTIEFSCTKEAKVSTEEDGRGSQIFFWPLNKIIQSKESKIFKTSVKVEIEMSTVLLEPKPNKTISMTKSDVDSFNKLIQEVQSLQVGQSMFTNNEDEDECSRSSTFNNNSTATDQNMENDNYRHKDGTDENDSDLNQYVQSDISEDLPPIGKEFLLKFNSKVVTSVATKVWDDVGEIIAVSASQSAGRILQRVVIPLDYLEEKITPRELIRRIGRYAITDIGAAGLACLISTLVAGPAGYAVGIGLAVLLSPLDYFLGDRISKFLLHRTPEEEEAWRLEQLRKKKQGLLRKAYKILQIEEHASNWEVDRAYRDAARIYHPRERAQDIGNRFDVINKAYTLIKQERSKDTEENGLKNNTMTPIQAITEG